MKDRLQAAAEQNNRSLSAEAAFRLTASFVQPDELKALALLEERATSLQDRVAVRATLAHSIKARADGMDLRTRLLKRELDHLTSAAGAPAAAVDALTEELSKAEAEHRALRSELIRAEAAERRASFELKGYEEHIREVRERLNEGDKPPEPGDDPEIELQTKLPPFQR